MTRRHLFLGVQTLLSSPHLEGQNCVLNCVSRHCTILYVGDFCCIQFETELFVDYSFASLITYEGWNFNSGNYLFTTDTK